MRAMLLGGVIAALGFGGVSFAQSQVPAQVIVGGAIDSTITEADAYLSRPEPVEPPPGRACALAQAYFRAVSMGDYQAVVDLYEVNGIHMATSRPSIVGHGDLLAFYRNGAQDNRRRTIIPVGFVGGDAECFIIIATERTLGGQTRYALAAASHVTIGPNGKMATNIGFPRPFPGPVRQR